MRRASLQAHMLVSHHLHRGGDRHRTAQQAGRARRFPIPTPRRVGSVHSRIRCGFGRTPEDEHMSTAAQQVRLAGTALGRSRHVCAFFNSKDEEYRVLLPFISEGIAHGEKAFHIVKDTHRSEHRRRLEQAGIPVDRAEQTGQLEIRRWEDAYLREGRFDQNRMLALIEEVLQGGKAQGYPLTRLVANMEWALEDRPGVDDIVEYETRLN